LYLSQQPVDLRGRLSNPAEPLETLVGRGIAVSAAADKRAARRANHSPDGCRSADHNDEGQLSNPPNESPRAGPVMPLSATIEQSRSSRVQKRLRIAEVDELVAAYRAGGRVDALAARFDVHRTTVIAHLRRRHIKRRTTLTAWDHDMFSTAAALYASGQSLAAVAVRFGIDPSTAPTASAAPA
jgi:hypothetical protein